MTFIWIYLAGVLLAFLELCILCAWMVNNGVKIVRMDYYAVIGISLLSWLGFIVSTFAVAVTIWDDYHG